MPCCRGIGNWARERGDTVEYVAHPARAGGGAQLAGPVTWLPRRSGGLFDRTLRLGSALGAWRIRQALGPVLGRADIVHVHSNGLLAEVAVLLAIRARKPAVLTAVWHRDLALPAKRGRRISLRGRISTRRSSRSTAIG